MTSSRLVLRLAAVVGGVLVIGYIIHLQSEIARLEGRLAQAPAPATRERPAPAADAARAPGAPAKRTLTPEQRAAMIERLGGSGTSQSNPVWFATVPNNPEAAAFQRALQSVFEEAGWQIRGNVPVRFAMKPGVYVFSADEEPPEYVSQAHEALEAGGITVNAGRGYREFYKQKKAETPSWVGLELAEDQSYVIAVGRPAEDGAGS